MRLKLNWYLSLLSCSPRNSYFPFIGLRAPSRPLLRISVAIFLFGFTVTNFLPESFAAFDKRLRALKPSASMDLTSEKFSAMVSCSVLVHFSIWM